MASRKGTLLEKTVQQLLKLSGFDPKLNKIYKGYEIDVFLDHNGIKVGIECKQYERSTLAIRNLIHQWDSKNKELNFDKIVLVLMGCDVSLNDRKLAEKYGITIWDEKKLSKLLEEAVEKKAKIKELILKEIGISKIKPKNKESLVEQTEQQNEIRDKLEYIIEHLDKDSKCEVVFTEVGTENDVMVVIVDEKCKISTTETASKETNIFEAPKLIDNIFRKQYRALDNYKIKMNRPEIFNKNEAITKECIHEFKRSFGIRPKLKCIHCGHCWIY